MPSTYSKVCRSDEGAQAPPSDCCARDDGLFMEEDFSDYDGDGIVCDVDFCGDSDNDKSDDDRVVCDVEFCGDSDSDTDAEDEIDRPAVHTTDRKRTADGGLKGRCGNPHAATARLGGDSARLRRLDSAFAHDIMRPCNTLPGFCKCKNDGKCRASLLGGAFDNDYARYRQELSIARERTYSRRSYERYDEVVEVVKAEQYRQGTTHCSVFGVAVCTSCYFWFHGYSTHLYCRTRKLLRQEGDDTSCDTVFVDGTYMHAFT